MKFKKGNIPWNKGKYSIFNLPINTITYRKDYRGKKRRWIKLSFIKWELYARYIYMQHYGNIPKNFIIHHKDKNTLNDNISNLILEHRNKHIYYHNPNNKIDKEYDELAEIYYREEEN